MFPEELHHQFVVQIYHSLRARLRQQAHKLLHQRELETKLIAKLLSRSFPLIFGGSTRGRTNFQVKGMVADVDTDLEDEGKVEGVLVDAALDVLEPPVHRVFLGGLFRRQPELGYLSQGLVAAERVCKCERGVVSLLHYF